MLTPSRGRCAVVHLLALLVAPAARADWTQHTEARCTMISVGSANNIACANASDQLWKYTGGSNWSQLPGAAVDISIAADGTLWVVNRGGNLYRWTGGDWAQVAGPTDGSVPKHVSAGSANNVWIVTTNDNIYRWSNGWVKVGGALVQISAAADGTVVGVNAGHQIYRWLGGDNWTLMPGSPYSAFVQVAAGSANRIWALGTDMAIMNFTGSTWGLLPGNVKWVSIGADGTTWGANQESLVYSWTDTAATATLPDLPRDANGRMKVRLNHVATGRCLYTEAPANNGALGSYGCWDDPNMTFLMEPTGAGPNHFRLINAWQGACPYTQQPGNPVRSWSCWADPAMDYTFIPQGGSRVLVQNTRSGRCLVSTAVGANSVSEAACDGNAVIALEAGRVPMRWDWSPLPSGSIIAVHVTQGTPNVSSPTTMIGVDRWLRVDAQGWIKADGDKPAWFGVTNVPVASGECSRAVNGAGDPPCLRWKVQMGGRFYGGQPDPATYSANLYTETATAASADVGKSLYIFPSGLTNNWGQGSSFCGWIKMSDAAACASPTSLNSGNPCAPNYVRFFPNPSGAFGFERDGACGQGGYEFWVAR